MTVYINEEIRAMIAFSKTVVLINKKPTKNIRERGESDVQISRARYVPKAKTSE